MKQSQSRTDSWIITFVSPLLNLVIWGERGAGQRGAGQRGSGGRGAEGRGAEGRGAAWDG